MPIDGGLLHLISWFLLTEQLGLFWEQRKLSECLRHQWILGSLVKKLKFTRRKSARRRLHSRKSWPKCRWLKWVFNDLRVSVSAHLSFSQISSSQHDGNARTQQSHQQTGLLPPMYYPRSGSLPNVHMSTTNPNLAEMHQVRCKWVKFNFWLWPVGFGSELHSTRVVYDGRPQPCPSGCNSSQS